MNQVLVVVSEKKSNDKINCKTFPSFSLLQAHEKFNLERASSL